MMSPYSAEFTPTLNRHYFERIRDAVRWAHDEMEGQGQGTPAIDYAGIHGLLEAVLMRMPEDTVVALTYAPDPDTDRYANERERAD